MPELPEVETVRADVASKYVGRKLERITVTGRRTVRRHPPELLKSLEGHVLSSVGRRGKYLLFNWDDGQVMIAHLRMSGQMLAAKPGDPLAPHTHAVLSFKGAGELRFVDPRTFGEFFLAGPDELDHIGPDALDIDVAQLRGGVRGPPSEGQVASRRPKRPGRDRQHICRRNPLRGALAPRPARRVPESSRAQAASGGDPVGIAVGGGRPGIVPG